MLGYKISKVLYDNKIIDNIKLIISNRPNVRRRFNKHTFTKIIKNINNYNIFINVLENAENVIYEKYRITVHNQYYYPDKKIMITTDKYNHK
jgi:hypothetical protein